MAKLTNDTHLILFLFILYKIFGTYRFSELVRIIYYLSQKLCFKTNIKMYYMVVSSIRVQTFNTFQYSFSTKVLVHIFSHEIITILYVPNLCTKQLKALHGCMLAHQMYMHLMHISIHSIKCQDLGTFFRKDIRSNLIRDQVYGLFFNMKFSTLIIYLKQNKTINSNILMRE